MPDVENQKCVKYIKLLQNELPAMGENTGWL